MSRYNLNTHGAISMFWIGCITAVNTILKVCLRYLRLAKPSSSKPESPLSFVLQVNMKTPEGLAYRGLPFAEFIVCCRRRRLMHYGTFMEAIEKEREGERLPLLLLLRSPRRMGAKWVSDVSKLNSPTIGEAHSTSPLSPSPFLFLHWVSRNESN